MLEVALEKSHINIWDEQPSDSVSEVLIWACARGSAPARNVLLILEDILMFSGLF